MLNQFDPWSCARVSPLLLFIFGFSFTPFPLFSSLSLWCLFLCFSRLFTPWVDLHHDRLTWIVAHACPLPWPSLFTSFISFHYSIRLERAMLCQAQKLRSLKLKQYEACWNHPAISSSSSGMWQPQLRPPFLSLGFAAKPACQMCLRQIAAQDFTIFYCGEKDVKVLERLLQHRGRMAKFTND